MERILGSASCTYGTSNYSSLLLQTLVRVKATVLLTYMCSDLTFEPCLYCSNKCGNDDSLRNLQYLLKWVVIHFETADADVKKMLCLCVNALASSTEMFYVFFSTYTKSHMPVLLNISLFAKSNAVTQQRTLPVVDQLSVSALTGRTCELCSQGKCRGRHGGAGLEEQLNTHT